MTIRTHQLNYFYIISHNYTLLYITIVDNMHNIMKNNTILNDNISFQYKGDYFFNSNFRIRIE